MGDIGIKEEKRKSDVLNFGGWGGGGVRRGAR